MSRRVALLLAAYGVTLIAHPYAQAAAPAAGALAVQVAADILHVIANSKGSQENDDAQFQALSRQIADLSVKVDSVLAKLDTILAKFGQQSDEEARKRVRSAIGNITDSFNGYDSGTEWRQTALSDRSALHREILNLMDRSPDRNMALNSLLAGEAMAVEARLFDALNVAQAARTGSFRSYERYFTDALKAADPSSVAGQLATFTKIRDSMHQEFMKYDALAKKRSGLEGVWCPYGIPLQLWDCDAGQWCPMKFHFRVTGSFADGYTESQEVHPPLGVDREYKDRCTSPVGLLAKLCMKERDAQRVRGMFGCAGDADKNTYRGAKNLNRERDRYKSLDEQVTSLDDLAKALGELRTAASSLVHGAAKQSRRTPA